MALSPEYKHVLEDIRWRPGTESILLTATSLLEELEVVDGHVHLLHHHVGSSPEVTIDDEKHFVAGNALHKERLSLLLSRKGLNITIDHARPFQDLPVNNTFTSERRAKFAASSRVAISLGMETVSIFLSDYLGRDQRHREKVRVEDFAVLFDQTVSLMGLQHRVKEEAPQEVVSLSEAASFARAA